MIWVCCLLRDFLIAAYLVWKQNNFIQQKHEKCKLLAMYSVGLYSINTSDRRQSKTLILWTDVDLRSLETEFLIAVCRLTVNYS